MNREAILGYGTGLAWLAPDMPFDTLWRTALLIHVCHAVVCALLARAGGRSGRLWSAIGFCAGVWAVLVLLVLPVKTRQ